MVDQIDAQDVSVDDMDAEALLAFRTQEEKHLLRQAEIAADVEALQRTDGGKALLDRAVTTVRECLMSLLLEHDLTSDAAKAAHTDARTAYLALKFMEDALRAGEDATTVLEEMDQEDMTNGR